MILLGDGYYGKTLLKCIEIAVEIYPRSPEPNPEPSSGGIPGYELISLISTMLIATSVLALILIKRTKLRQ